MPYSPKKRRIVRMIISKTEARQKAIANSLDFLEIQNSGSSLQPRLSIRQVAKRFGIKESTLRNAIKNGVPKRPGPPTVLTEEEERQLAGYCLNMQRLGFGLTKATINVKVLEILRAGNRNHPFAKGGPSKDWWHRFMNDHPELSFRVPQALTAARAQRGNPVIVRDHFAKLEKILKDYELAPEQIWNMDETGFNIASRLEKVIAKKGARQVHKIAQGNSNEHISVCATISAGGHYIPPLIIYKGVRASAGLLDGSPAGTKAAFTESGYIHQNIFRMYMEHFNASVPPRRPVMLMLDGHGSHIDLSSIDYCRENNIILYALPPNTTHILQPAEIAFRNLKREYDKAVSRYNHENNGALVTKLTFARVFGEAWIATYTPLAITQSFKATGIHPLNPNVIDPARLEPSLPTQNVDPLEPFAAPIASSSTVIVSRGEEVDALRKRIKELELENERLKNPGTTSLAAILQYPLVRQEASAGQPEGSRKRKGVKFSRLLTDDDIRKELQEREDAAILQVQQKAQCAAKRQRKQEEKEETKRKKEEQVRKRGEQQRRKEEERRRKE
jgi:DDE superfamily endonuclease